jgi:hypothetical protein
VTEPGRAPREVWTLGAYGVGGLFVLMLLYLGLRPGGRGPVLVWSVGLQLATLFAFALLAAGGIWSARHRPFLRPGRNLAFAILVLVAGAGAYPLPYPSSHEGHESTICFRLPFDGEWTVLWGGEKKEENLLCVASAGRRWGLDFVVAVDGRTHSGDGRAASDYYAFGREVRAPAAGKVVRVVDGIEDGAPGAIDRRVDPAGNRVVIRVAEGEFLFVGHLAKGSAAVRVGDDVRSGDLLGRVGSSGGSKVAPEPHLEIHLQDTPEDERGEPIPWRFCAYIADGVRVEKGLPRGGLGRGGALTGQRVAPQGG